MAVIQHTADTLPSPPSPSLTNPDMILPYDPRLRDSVSTENTEASAGPDINSLSNQMALSLSASQTAQKNGWGSDRKNAKRVNASLEANEKQEFPNAPASASATEIDNTFSPGTSFLNLSRYSTVSGMPPTRTEEDMEMPSIDEQENESELTARNDFARAEEILANAKKRLTAMEGNLTRARSLSVSRSASVASGLPEDRTSWRTSDSSAHANGWAISAAKLRQTGRSQGGSATNHMRVFSENAVPNQNPNLVEKVNGGETDQRRSSSAMGAFGGENSSTPAHYEGYYRGGMGRLEPLREDEQLTPSPDNRTNSRTGLDRLQDLPAKARSNVQLRDLRDQMQDLKDKLSVLKKRTREDSMHRRSMQYLKSPSPFTDAEAWRNTPPRNGSRQSTRRSEDTPRSGDTPRPGDTPKPQIASENATPKPPPPQIVPIAPGSIYDEDALGSPGAMVKGPRGVIEGALTSLDEKLSKSPHASPRQGPISHRPNLSGSLPLPPSIIERSAFEPWSPHSEKAEILNFSDFDTQDSSEDENKTESTQSDEAPAGIPTEAPEDTDKPVTSSSPSKGAAAEVSHEQRPDAFDYENFVISSTMGTYERSRQRSRSSSSSTSTIGPDDYPESNSPSTLPGAFTGVATAIRPYHTRQQSGESNASLDTFATAQSRSGSRLQAGSRQALREAASREMIAGMPGAFVNSNAPTPVPPSEPFADEHGMRPNHLRSDSYASSEGTERPGSFLPASDSGHHSYAHYSVASTVPSIFSSTNAAPVIDPATDLTGIAARTAILRTLLVHPLPTATGSRNSEVATISETDEALVRSVIEGLQRACGKLAWSAALYGKNVGGKEVEAVRQRLDAARVALEDKSETNGEGDEYDEDEEDDKDEEHANYSAKREDSWFTGRVEEH